MITEDPRQYGRKSSVIMEQLIAQRASAPLFSLGLMTSRERQADG